MTLRNRLDRLWREHRTADHAELQADVDYLVWVAEKYRRVAAYLVVTNAPASYVARVEELLGELVPVERIRDFWPLAPLVAECRRVMHQATEYRTMLDELRDEAGKVVAAGRQGSLFRRLFGAEAERVAALGKRFRADVATIEELIAAHPPASDDDALGTEYLHFLDVRFGSELMPIPRIVPPWRILMIEQQL